MNLKALLSIFKDDNEWNEKTIIGFLSFAMMVIIATVDTVTGFVGINLAVQEFIYNSFVMVTLGSFGVAGVEKFSSSERDKVRNRREDNSHNRYEEDDCHDHLSP